MRKIAERTDIMIVLDSLRLCSGVIHHMEPHRPATGWRNKARLLIRISAARHAWWLCLWLAAWGYARADAAGIQALEILTADGRRVSFRVEIADTEEKRSRGLMGRTAMPEDYGMLFDFREDASVSMWMRGTLIPLDMLFIRADGIIARAVIGVAPLSERLIGSGGPVRAVLELNAGTCVRHGIEAGDRVVHPMFSNGD